MDGSKPDVTPEGIRIYAPEDFEGMRRAGRVAAEILDEVAPLVRVGATTAEIDAAIAQMVTDKGTVSATIGYRGYQHASCISVNHVVCHGIPGSEIPKSKYEKKKRGDDVLVDGDILNIDVTVILDGWYGDSSRMYIAGSPKPFALRLIDVTHEALMRGIAAAKPGATFGDIGHAIQVYAEGQNCSVVRDFCGHGLGTAFHEPPNVLHYGRPGTGATLRPGMFFTIEPMINLGRYETKTLSDGWTAVTRDGTMSAQFEHSIGITEEGAEIFTLSPAGKFHPTWG
ncbi:type I methionyl aminopeptidase [Rhodovulum sp. DZ06]|uniref:type I methionyl aminopeptidase n=1 Tax=Rhodovulum sp. DZ06 TaxID=3425126 RepID=UPI003D33C5B4